MEKFKKEIKSKYINPIDWFNFNGSFVSIFESEKKLHVISETEISCMSDIKKVAFRLLENGIVEVLADNPYDIATSCKMTKFMMLTAVKYKGDYFAAMSYVRLYLMKEDIPYIRVGSDYFKIINKTDRYGGNHSLLKHWKKDEIKEDHSKELLKLVYKFDDFDIIPNNIDYVPVKNGCYNLYSKFPHQQVFENVKETDIPFSIGIMKHIFGDQIELGFKYMKILYEHPTQILPILVLVSIKRATGKTTFLNWINMIFGQNSVLISPQDLMSNFNSIYSTKNIIMVDETVIEKSASVEKLKSLATAKSISVSQKNVAEYSIPFFGKVILCTNKEKDFMRIDEEEVRFWVRKIEPITNLNTNIENDLFNEITKFLKYLSQLPQIDFSKSRMVFTMEEINTNELNNIKHESKSALYKDIEIIIEDFFNQNDIDMFYATAIDLKNRYFLHRQDVSFNYIFKVLKEEMKIDLIEKVEKYNSFGENELNKKNGRPFIFNRNRFSNFKEETVKIQHVDLQEDNEYLF